MEIDIQTCNWDEVNINEVAQLLFTASNASPFWDPDRSHNWFQQFINQNIERVSPSFVLLARSGKDLVGMTSIITSNLILYDLWRWHPVVLPGENEAEIATALIEASINHMKVAGAHSLEVCFDFIGAEMTSETELFYHKYKSWYQHCGAEIIDEFVFMTREAFGFKPAPKNFLKGGFEINSFSIQDKNGVYDCFYQSFLSGKDRSFLGKTEEQRRKMFDGYFDDPENFHEDASLILSKKGQVVGFSVFKTRPYVIDEHLVLLCVHPDYQGQSLGKQLLKLSISKIAHQEKKLISLGVDMDNRPAYKLYRKLGFTTQTKFITYAFKNEEIS